MNQDLDGNKHSADSENLTPDNIAELVRNLSKTMKDTGVHQLSVKLGDVRIKLSTASTSTDTRSTTRSSMQPDVSHDLDEPPENDSTDFVVTAPMIGTFYTSPAPNEPPFVQVGDIVEEGQTVGIIEAMKIMNEIASDKSGKVVEIIASNGETVEYGSPLVLLNPDSV